ncbi:MAG: SDR family NAD(P)-dependent oxidoreductase [Sphingomonadaceae bacterium]
MTQFDGQVAFVTGAAGGIGKACAEGFARKGAMVAVADIAIDAAKRVANALRASGAQAFAVHLDVSDSQSCALAVAETVAQFGGLHMAVNNAAVPTPPYAEFEDMDTADWNRAIAINLTGVFNCMKPEAKAIRLAGGTSIVNISSMMSRKSASGQAAYMASKHGVIGLTKGAAMDLVRHGIRVNAVCPGFVDTPMLAPALEDEAERDVIHGMIPAGRVASPDEIAAAVLFASSAEASYMVGASLRVDAGSTL